MDTTMRSRRGELRTASARVVVVVAMLLAVMVGSCFVVSSSAHAASPHNLGQPTWTDCGPDVCTKYWSVERTKNLYQSIDTWQWSTARVLETGVNLVLAIVTQRSQASTDGFESSLREANVRDGCLQFAWRKDGAGSGVYGWTGHPDYCGSENARYDSVSRVA
ncbi:hypothetical protein [Gordonia sp. NB41Y]|uniref:hypothetical protein n=1 Tax=Gordonia sp. NB41Y TaxID=875808 RepID=UPI0006B22FFE|nr:hypothetical protein [Gordonia sp. NB41Y]KOY48909.1 hypothetical protein ISGA_13750 [Gordonia sp. NB41Y]WLP92137.1 hypothetical protein Q9K23_07875 [Gordonia sp. NB41Y]